MAPVGGLIAGQEPLVQEGSFGVRPSCTVVVRLARPRANRVGALAHRANIWEYVRSEPVVQTKLLTGRNVEWFSLGRRIATTVPRSLRQTRRRSVAHLVSSCLVDSCNFRSTEETCDSTVLVEMVKSRATSL
jgi:hypothetical protein